MKAERKTGKRCGVLWLVLMLVLVAGCAPTPATDEPTAAVTDPTLVPAATPTDPPPTALPSPTTPVFEPTFEEAPCPFEASAGSASCGYVVVPLDHGSPDGATIRLAVAVFADQSDDHQPDPVVLLAGGPGEKTAHAAQAIDYIFAPFTTGRDLVIFDQRGTGLSEPALECPEAEQAAVDLLAETDQSVAAKASFDAIITCRDRLVAEGNDLAAYTTRQNAADVEAIRVALGYDEINLYGGSYGSQLAQAVMRHYPDHIRSVVLESTYPLEASLLVDSARTVPEAILRLLDACKNDAACSSTYPDLQDKLYEVIDRLNADPVQVTLVHPRTGAQHDAVLSGDAVLGILRAVLYQTAMIPELPQAVYDVHGGDYTLITQLASTRLAFVGAISLGMEYSMLCTDDLVGRSIEDALALREALPRQLVGSGDPDVIRTYGAFAICAAWPVETADASVKAPVVSDIPTLILAGEFDPVTPPEYGRLVASHLTNGYFFELPGGGHSGESVGTCALAITAAFLADPTTPPDASCVAEMPGLVFNIPTEPAAVSLVPYSNADLGLQGVVPEGWREVQAGTFARASSALDSVALQMAASSGGSLEVLLASISQNYGLADVPAPAGEREANGLKWTLYGLDVPNAPRWLALAESDTGVLILVVRTTPDEREQLFEDVVLPMVDALMPLDEG